MQRTVLKIIFPFSIEGINIEKIKSKIVKQNWKEAEFSKIEPNQLINESSHFFDYIENLVLKGRISEFDYIGETPLMELILDNFNKRLQKETSINQNDDAKKKIEQIKNSFLNIQYKPVTMRIFLFSSQILFLEISLENNDDTKAKEYFKRLIKIKSFFKKVDIVNLASNLTNIDEECFEPFDKQKEGKNKKTARFQIFSEIQLNDNNKFITQNDHFLLENYFLNRNSTESIYLFPMKQFSEEAIFAGSSVSCSIEGAIVITRESKINSRILKQMYKSFIQNIYYSFILTIHQFYYLHKIGISISKIDAGDKFNKKTIQATYDLFNFKSKYMFNIVSQFCYLQNVHDFFSKTYKIEQFENEVTTSIKPIRELIKERKDTTFVRATQIFAIFAALSALLTFSSYIISNLIVAFSLLHLYFLIGTIAVILVCLMTLLFFYRKYWK